MYRRAVIFGCTYEAVAAGTGRVPTLTAICKRHPVLRWLLLAALAAHLIWGWQS